MGLKLMTCFLILASFFSSCKDGNKNEATQVSEDLKTFSTDRCVKEIGGLVGIIQPNDSTYQFGDEIQIYNEQKKVFDTISIEEEYQDFAYDCRSHDDDYYKIRWGKNDWAYLKKSEKIELVSWNDYLMYSLIRFDAQENPIRVNKTNGSDILPYSNDEFYRVIEIDGEWAKIDWGSSKQRSSGWIKWRNENCIIVEVSPFA